MKSFSLIKVVIIFTLLSVYCIGVDLALSGRIDLTYLQFETFKIYSSGITVGMIVFYSCMAAAFKFNLIDLLMGKSYDNNLFNIGKYRILPISIVFGLSFSGYITYISIPIMLLVSIELIYLSIAYRYDEKK